MAILSLACFEDSKFVGVITFGMGVNPNYGKKYGLRQGEIYELTRVALNRKAHKQPTTQYVAIALRLLKKTKPLAKVVVSYADKGEQNHEGIIYKAGNWYYEGEITASQPIIDGKVAHSRKVNMNKEKYRDNIQRYTNGLKKKFIYVYNKNMRVELESKALGFQPRESGAVPTNTHQKKLS